MSKRFEKDYRLDGWPVTDNELGRVLGTNDIVVALNSYEKNYSEMLSKHEAVLKELESARQDIKHYKAELDKVCETGCTPADAKKLREANHGLSSDLELRELEISALHDNQLRMTDEYNDLIIIRVELQSDIRDLETEKKIQALENITLYRELQTHLESLPKIKADAVREAAKRCNRYAGEFASVIDLEEHADKLEQGIVDHYSEYADPVLDEAIDLLGDES